MGKSAAVLGVAFVGLAAFALFLGWAFFRISVVGGGWRSLGPIWPYVVGGMVAMAALLGFFMWLAFYSARHGHDDLDRS